MAETKYAMAFGENLAIKNEWVKATYAEASELARKSTQPGYSTYVVRIVPVAVFTAKVVMEPVAQPEADVVNFVG